MGLCFSSGAAGEAARAAAPRDTALVLMPGGELREYPRPATAARVLEDASDDGWFLCDADRMGFEGPVPAVPAAEALRAGQIYFVLPAGARRRGLSREEVAALAVRASAALSANGAGSGSGGRRRRGAVAPLVFAPPEEEPEDVEQTFAVAYKVAPARKRRPAAARSGRRLERFASDLTAIPECEMSSE
ncbi:hypothetical protein BAE44_0013875 [Dichanthelium oligosanthes]|uniref:Uncharacterized protein n=1 Tax=Dichanthelium oligosanthes TaxID=888268 RepID=A0A1E5VJ23_9POAL|nr:hypothetical protein BAE44_0013875 [Dichanthelium oligosanthes]